MKKRKWNPSPEAREKLRQRHLRTDLGLAISAATLRPGQSRSINQLADFCGCSKQSIHGIQQRALTKLRKALIPEKHKLEL